MLKSYLGTPGSAFDELDLPIAHVQPLCGTGLTSATAAKIQQHLNIVIIVRNSPMRAQLVAQYILEIKRCVQSCTRLVKRLHTENGIPSISSCLLHTSVAFLLFARFLEWGRQPENDDR